MPAISPKLGEFLIKTTKAKDIDNAFQKIFQTSLFRAQNRPIFWTVAHLIGEAPTSILRSFPAGVVTPSSVNLRQSCI